MRQLSKFKFSVFVDLSHVIKDIQNSRILLYGLLAKLNTYDHIDRIFVLNNYSPTPYDVPGDELKHNNDTTKSQYYMFYQQPGTPEFFNKVLNIDDNYKLDQAKTSDIVYITTQDNTDLANLRMIYYVIPNPNLITIKFYSTDPDLFKSGINDVIDFLSLSGKPLSIRIAKNAIPSTLQTKVLSYVDKYRSQDPRRVVTVYPARDKYQVPQTDSSLFNMYFTDPSTELLTDDLVARITSVTPINMARFLSKLFTIKSDPNTLIKTGGKVRLASRLRRFTRKVLGRVSSRRKQALDLDEELRIIKSSRVKSSRKSKPASTKLNSVEVRERLSTAAKYLAEIERLDSLIAESGKSRQQKQKTSSQRSVIEDINRQYRAHRSGFIRAIRNLFKHGESSAKSYLYNIDATTTNHRTKKLIERIMRVLDDKSIISNITANKRNNLIDVDKLRRNYAGTLRQNISANPGFFKKLTRKRILSQVVTK